MIMTKAGSSMIKVTRTPSRGFASHIPVYHRITYAERSTPLKMHKSWSQLTYRTLPANKALGFLVQYSSSR